MKSKPQLASHKIISSGVDWLTVTRSRERDDDALREVAYSIMEDEARVGNEVRAWHAQGYKGYQCGEIFVGVRHDSWICKISSDLARERWKELYAVASNVTRLDVQLTVEFDAPQPEIIRTLHGDAISHKKGAGKPSNRTLIDSTLTGQTLMIGQRASDQFIRIYDKGRESKMRDAGLWVRYEVEMKRDRAKRLAFELNEAEHEQASAVMYLCTNVQRQGVRVPESSGEWQWDSLSLAQPDMARKLAWVGRCIRPSIKTLLQHYTRAEIMNALGLLEE